MCFHLPKSTCYTAFQWLTCLSPFLNVLTMSFILEPHLARILSAFHGNRSLINHQCIELAPNYWDNFSKFKLEFMTIIIWIFFPWNDRFNLLMLFV